MAASKTPLAFNAPGFVASMQVIMLKLVNEVVNETVSKAARNGPAVGWPIGRERNRPHSYKLFAIDSGLRGTSTATVTIKNSALYATFIHERGNPERYVLDREINEKIPRRMRDTLINQLPGLIAKGIGGRRG